MCHHDGIYVQVAVVWTSAGGGSGCMTVCSVARRVSTRRSMISHGSGVLMDSYKIRFVQSGGVLYKRIDRCICAVFVHCRMWMLFEGIYSFLCLDGCCPLGYCYMCSQVRSVKVACA